MKSLGLGWRVATALTMGMAVQMLSGCNGFFVYPGSTTASSTTSSNTGDDYVYVANSSYAGSGATSQNYINGYVVSSAGALTATTSSPYNLQYTPQAMKITPNDLFLYVASDSQIAGNSGYLYGYQIGTGGALNILNSGTALVTGAIAAIDISSDGNWLFTLSSNSGNLLGTLTVMCYAINSSTGALTAESSCSTSYTGAAGVTSTPNSIKVAPSVDFIVATLEQGGLVTFPFNTTTGVIGPGQSLVTPAYTSNAINAATVDANNNIYASGAFGASATPSIQVYTSTSAGFPTPVGNPVPTGTGPNAIVLNKAGTYLYSADESVSTTNGLISPFSIATGPALTALTTVSAPPDVSAIAIDSTGNFLLASGYSATVGLQVYSIGSTGALTLVSASNEPTSTTQVPSLIAATH